MITASSASPTPADASKLVERLRWSAYKSPDQHGHWVVMCDGTIVCTCWRGEVDAVEIANAHNAADQSSDYWCNLHSTDKARYESELAAAKREAQNVRAQTIEECAKVCEAKVSSGSAHDWDFACAVCARDVRALAQRGQ